MLDGRGNSRGWGFMDLLFISFLLFQSIQLLN